MQAERTPEERKAAAEDGVNALFGVDASGVRSWPAEFVDLVTEAWKSANSIPPDAARKHILMMLNLTPNEWEAKADDLGKFVAWGRQYRGYRDEGKTSKEAATLAAAGYSF